MARRRRGGAPGDPETPQEPVVQGTEPRVEMRMTGSAEAVKRQLGVQTQEKPEDGKPSDDNGQDHEKKKFTDALRNSQYIIRVKRLTPREFNGVKTNVEVWSAELPLTYQEIREEVTKACVGGKYRVAVVDPNT